MSEWNFTPVLGLTGSGKTAWLNRRIDNGAQVLSVELLAGVTGVCLRNLSGPVISPGDLEDALMAKLASFDPARSVYVEWKPELVHRVELPSWFVACVRRATAWCIVEPFARRVDRLLADYGPLADHLDYVVEIFERSNVLSREDLCMLRGFEVSDDARGMVAFLMEHYFDPLYIEDVKAFPAVGFGRFSDTSDAFFGSVQMSPVDVTGLLMDGVLAGPPALSRPGVVSSF
jgi:hypothetical protein